MKLPFQPFDKNADFAQTRRRLPHRTQPGCTYFVTWRLTDSVPREVLEGWKQERGEFYRLHPQPWDTRTQRAYDERFPRRMERWADAGHGACHLREPHLRQIMVDAFHHFDAQRYDLDSYVVMPNHVHVLVTPRGESDADIPVCTSEMNKSDADIPVCIGEGSAREHTHVDADRNVRITLGQPSRLSKFLQVWKGFTARAINQALGRSGSLWMDESFDHAVRSELQLDRFRRYIRENPVKAGLKDGEFSLWEKQRVAELQSAPRSIAEVRSAASQQPAAS